MRYIIEVYDRKKTYYFYPSPYGNIMTDDPQLINSNKI